MKRQSLLQPVAILSMVLGMSITRGGPNPAPVGPGSEADSTSEAVRAREAPARQFAFLIGKWRVEQLLPKPSEADSAQQVLEEWAPLPDGSLLGKSFTAGATDTSNIIEIRLIIEGGRYFHTLKGPAFTGGAVLKMPIVQVSRTTVVSVNRFEHVPARTTYDLLADGSLLAAIYVKQEGQYVVWRMTKL